MHIHILFNSEFTAYAASTCCEVSGVEFSPSEQQSLCFNYVFGDHKTKNVNLESSSKSGIGEN